MTMENTPCSKSAIATASPSFFKVVREFFKLKILHCYTLRFPLRLSRPAALPDSRVAIGSDPAKIDSGPGRKSPKR